MSSIEIDLTEVVTDVILGLAAGSLDAATSQS
ncbi:Uncharacterised protein [Gordonia paraffinivorans]|uniref:Uncharacterized protein n=1 Tax=Gordonia paraffinivorans TaxID=175628 RepID=A0ABD7V5X8_9ACTN|nr:Uncharacterised protein [Gordonia paraffinivorans]